MLVYMCVHSLECLCHVARHVVADITSRPGALTHSHFAYFNLHALNIKKSMERGLKQDKKCTSENHDFFGKCPLEISA